MLLSLGYCTAEKKTRRAEPSAHPLFIPFRYRGDAEGFVAVMSESSLHAFEDRYAGINI